MVSELEERLLRLRYCLNHRCYGAIIKFRVGISLNLNLQAEMLGQAADDDEDTQSSPVCSTCPQDRAKAARQSKVLRGLYRIVKNILPWGQGFLKEILKNTAHGSPSSAKNLTSTPRDSESNENTLQSPPSYLRCLTCFPWAHSCPDTVPFPALLCALDAPHPRRQCLLHVPTLQRTPFYNTHHTCDCFLSPCDARI